MATADPQPLSHPWAPHDGQAPILESDARFRIVACGRRWGKTTCAANWAVKRAVEPDASLVWWVGPGYEVIDPGYHEVVDSLAALAEESDRRVVADTKQSKPYHIDLTNGCRIAFRTTNTDTNVGVGLDALVIDEAAQVSEQRWKRDLRPTLSDTLGDMMAISTPRGRNWFHEYFQRGQSPDYPDVESWTASTYDNPHVPDSEVDAAREELPERIFRQEYLAEFVDDSGGVFERVRERIVADYDYEAVAGEAPYTIGVDFARHQDWTVIVVLDDAGQLVDFDRVRDVTWPDIQRRVERMHSEYGGTAYVDASRDNKIVSDLERAGVTVEPVTFSPQTKRELVENLATAIEQEALTIPDLPELVNELQIFEYETTRAGNVRYHAPEGFHDDCVDALALAMRGRTSTPSQGGFIVSN